MQQIQGKKWTRLFFDKIEKRRYLPQNYLDKGLYGILVIDWLDKYFFKSGPLEITFVIFFIPFVLLIDYTPGSFSVFLFLLRRRVEGQIHPFYCDIQHYFTRWKHYLDFY